MYLVRYEQVALVVPENSPVAFILHGNELSCRVVLRPKEKHKIRIYVKLLSGEHHAGSGYLDDIGEKH